MPDPLVSILIPCHNAAPWIEAALTSALAQTWSAVEVIVLDDGSTDNSLPLARRFASRHCHVISQPQSGASAARNRAWAEAQGEYIQYLDADDLLASHKIERQLRAALRNSGDLTFGEVIRFRDQADFSGARPDPLPPAAEQPVEFLEDLWCGDRGAEMVQTGQWLTPRGLIEKAGPWNEELSVDDDGEFFARVILAAGRLSAAPGAICHYRQHRGQGNLSASGNRVSAMRAAQLKSDALLGRTASARACQAVRRLITREMIDAYPQHPGVVRSGKQFLRDHGLSMTDALEGSPWFRRMAPILGWKKARAVAVKMSALRSRIRATE